MKTIVSVCSARPNFVKLAAVHHALEEAGEDFLHVIVHTGQHYDPLFSDIFFQELNIPDPAFNLGIKGGDREEVILETQSAFETLLPQIKPDIVLVYGDVNGALGAARAAKEGGFTLGHVEAGLRSFDSSMPEELNRIEIDRLADILLCSEPSAIDNLKHEGITEGVHLVGNTMIDTLIRMMPVIDGMDLPSDLPADYAIVTLHRPSNVDDAEMLNRNIEVLQSHSEHILLVCPMHHRLKAALNTHGLSEIFAKAVMMSPPLGYLPFLRLLKGARFVLTDSGGIQEEATFLQKRCYTLRKNTERPITVESGSNVLIDLAREEDRDRLVQAALNTEKPSIDVPVLWDGKAGERIVSVLATSL